MIAVDLFAGLGGSSLGATQAGATVVAAVNHWDKAVEFHARNHPGTMHIQEDIERLDWTQIPKHDLLLASPACQGHSKARGRERPHHDAQRLTAWGVVQAAEAHRAPVLIVENVPEFKTWVLFPAWKDALHRLGYSISENLVDAADLGVPQRRVRLFLVCTRSRNPITLTLGKVPHRPARTIINLDTGRWSPVDAPGRAEATLRRIDQGRKVYGSEPFLLAYYGGEKGGRSLDKPLGTVRTKVAHAVVVGNKMRMLTLAEGRKAMGFPDEYELPSNLKDAWKLLGNAVCPPVARAVVEAVRKAA